MSGPQSIITPPTGTNFIAVIQPSLTFLLIGTPLGATLVPVIILLLFFSSQSSRKIPIFTLNIIACSLGLLVAFLNGVLEVKQILHPRESISQALFVVTITATITMPMIVDSILLARILAFYPSPMSTWRDRLKVLVFPICVKFTRFTILSLYLHQFVVKSTDLGSVLLVGQATWFRNPYIITEWSLQVVDNSYSSFFFLHKLRIFDAKGRTGWIMRHPTVLKRIRGLFYMALGNFIFPLILNVVQMIFITCDRSFLHGTYVMLVNDYVSIFGVVFATIWTSSSHWSQQTTGSSGSSWNQNSSEEQTNYGGLRRGLAVHAVELSSRYLDSNAHANDSGSKLRAANEYETQTDRSSEV